jgi:hypothetical protein
MMDLSGAGAAGAYRPDDALDQDAGAEAGASPPGDASPPGGSVPRPGPKDTQDGRPVYGTAVFHGPLFVDGVSPSDVLQGHLGDCYLAAALGAIAAARPQAIKDMITASRDGTYTVRFFPKGDRTHPVFIQVDGELPVDKKGGAYYGGSRAPDAAKKAELWFPIVEKAYAKWKGGYDKIDGGIPEKPFHEILGGDFAWFDTTKYDEDALYAGIARFQRERRPMTAKSLDQDNPQLRRASILSDHFYTVLGAEERDGRRFVVLRNPWGYKEPGGAAFDGRDDGVFRLPIENFKKLFGWVEVPVTPELPRESARLGPG